MIHHQSSHNIDYVKLYGLLLDKFVASLSNLGQPIYTVK